MELLRIFNRYDLPEEKKRAGVALIGEVDALLGLASQPLKLTPATEERILSLASKSVYVLKRDFGLSLRCEAPESVPIM